MRLHRSDCQRSRSFERGVSGTCEPETQGPEGSCSVRSGRSGHPIRSFDFTARDCSRSCSRAPLLPFGYPSRKALALDESSLADRPRAAPSRGIRSSGGLTLSLHPARASPVLRDGPSLTTDSSHRSAPERAAILKSTLCELWSYPASASSSGTGTLPLTLGRVGSPSTGPSFSGPHPQITLLGSRSSRSRFRWSSSSDFSEKALPRALLATEPCGESATLALDLWG